MFTGIIEEKGKIKRISRSGNFSVLTVGGKDIFSDLAIGDSVAVNGVCLTVTGISAETFTADVMHETLNRSSLGDLSVGSNVNLERAMPVNGRFGGHIVSGHIDGTGRIIRTRDDGIAVWYTIAAESEILKYIVIKGSVAIDGISLTVADRGADWFSVSVIPHTAKVTILGEKSPGDIVNLEVDIIGKYVEQLMKKETTGGLTEEFLRENGF